MTISQLRRGWCPSALRPMETGDGLLVRLHPRALVPDRARALAQAARRFGNGLIELTSRGNVQLRGLTQATHPPLVDYLAENGILDDDARRPVLASPLAGLPQFGALLDIAPLVAALERRLAAMPIVEGLPEKFSIIVDDGGWPSLADVRADLRFEVYRTTDGAGFRIAVDGTSQTAREVARSAAHEIAEQAVSFLSRHCAPIAPASGRIDWQAAAAAAPPIGLFHGTQGQTLLGLGFAFGRLTADALDLVAAAAEDLRCANLRLTPWRAILLPLGTATGLAVWQARFETAGFIFEPADPRLAIAACPGAPACGNATTPTQVDALQLAALARRFAPRGIGIHVSGCIKGCASAQPVPVTLVADAGLYRLVRNGKAQDASVGAPFPIAAANDILEALLASPP